MSIGYKLVVVGLILYFNGISCSPLSEVNHIIHLVNSIPKHSWKAGINFHPSFLTNVSRLMGVLPRNKLSEKDTLLSYDSPIGSEPLPESYDVTQTWSECKSVVSIRDQSNCGSCWALSTASAFSDRLCIASNMDFNKVLSGEYINSCCNGKCGDGCNGGHPEKAWKYIKKNGLCTGGEYNSNEGCQPYSIFPCPRNSNSCSKENEDTPQCYKDQCTNSIYEIPLSSDLYYATKVYSVRPKPEIIMNDIYKNGPVVAAMKVYEDLLQYKGGIYQYTAGALKGDHAVKIMGWGQDDGIDYWLCANTWGTSWGMGGMFKIRRGRNECGIENRITGGLPKVSKIRTGGILHVINLTLKSIIPGNRWNLQTPVHLYIITDSTMSRYKTTFCVKCGQKTGWIIPVNLRMTRNRTPVLRGKCCKCRCNKSTFVTLCYYKMQMRKCKRSGSRCRK